MSTIASERSVPQLPPQGKKLRLLIDSDAANEVDDLYAISLALLAPDRFIIEGFIATHFAASAGPDSIERSYTLMLQLLDAAGVGGKYPIKRGGHPMQYMGTPSSSEGVDFIIERAYSGSENDPLWVVGLGAATNLASAVLKEPSIANRVRYVYHARSHMTWPERSVQYNVKGDVLAARTLLQVPVPLAWFDTGTNICCSFETTAKYVAPTGSLGKFLHEYRGRYAGWMTEDKGFFDLGDIAWMLKPEICSTEVLPAPTMDQCMFFDHKSMNGNMLRIFNINAAATWELFFEMLRKYSGVIRLY